MSKISVVIVNYNAGRKILECISSVKNFFSGDYKIVVADNASSDGSCTAIENEHPDVKVLYVGYNAGFGVACNIAARSVESEYLIFLNPDAYVESDCASIMKSVMERDKKTAFVGGCLNNENGMPGFSYGRFPTIMSCFLECFFGSKTPPKPEGSTVDFVSGALLMVRHDVFDFLGGFDDSFFMYFEETDLQFRANSCGYKSVYEPSAVAMHEGGGTCPNHFKRLLRSLHGMRVYFKKRQGMRGLLAASILSSIYIVTRWPLYKLRSMK